MSYVLGLTGSIGMGKSTTAALFAAAGCAVWDADAAVHRLYAKGGLAVAPIARVFAEAIEDGGVSRDRIKEIIAQDPDAIKTIEAIVHPLVAQDRQNFLAQSDAQIVVLDIPLLFENGSEAMMDAVVCVTAPPDVQKQRVLARPGMTEERLAFILSRQMPDAEKRRRADFVVTTETMDAARAQVDAILTEIRTRPDHA